MQRTLESLLLNEYLQLVAGLATELGVRAYFVGGGLRDVLLGRESNDLDFALSGATRDLPALFAKRTEGSFFWLDELRQQARVVTRRNNQLLTFDFAPLLGAGIAEDLALRDFTINALALPLGPGEISVIDPLSGYDDLRNGLVRACSEDAFDQDPLRLLRAFRFAATLRFTIESDTLQAIRNKADLLGNVAAERVRGEFFQILAAAEAADSLQQLFSAGLLGKIMPCSKVPLEGFGGSWTARSATVSAVEKIMDDLDTHFPSSTAEIRDYLGREIEKGVTVRSLVKLAAFLAGDDCRCTPVELAERFKLGRKTVTFLTLFARQPEPVFASLVQRPTSRGLFRFFRDREPVGPALLILALAGKYLPGDLIAEMMRYHFFDYPLVREEALLSGDDVMDILGIGTGNRVGDALLQVKEAESRGLVNNRAEALAFLEKNLLTKTKPVR